MVKCYRKTVSLSDLWVSSHEKLSDFYTSSWQPGESPVPMLVIRLILTCVVLSILAWAVVDGANVYWLIYLTNWGLVLVSMMMISGTAVSIVAVCKKPYESGELPWYICLYWFMFNIAVPIALMITTLYWVLLYEPEPEEYNPRAFWLDVATHGFNSCIAFGELMISRTPLRFFHVYQSMGVGLWYAAFTGIYYAAGGTDGNGNPFIYEILDWRQSRRAGTIIAASVVGLLLIYTVLWGLTLCRDKISSAIRTTSLDLPLTPPDKHMATRIV